MTSASMLSPASRAAAATARIAMIELRDDRQVAPGAADRRLADRHAVRFFRHRALRLVQQLVLEDQHRVRIVDRRQQQAFGVVRRRRLHAPSGPGHARTRLRGSGCAVLPRLVPEPPGSRITIGTDGLAAEHEADLRRLVDDLLHRRGVTKSENWNSSTGFMPVIAAPTAAPAIPSSLIGVSITRSVPKRWNRSPDTPNAPPYTPTSSPNRKTRSSASIACASAFADRLAYDSSRVRLPGRQAQLGIDVAGQLRQDRGRGLPWRTRSASSIVRCAASLDREQLGFAQAAVRDAAPLRDERIAIACRARPRSLPWCDRGCGRFWNGRAAGRSCIRAASDRRRRARELNRRARRGDDGGQMRCRRRRCPASRMRGARSATLRHRHRARDVHRHAVFVVLADEHDRQLSRSTPC